MSEIVTITQSEMKALEMCPKKWWFNYDQLLVSKKPRRALDVGTATHNAIEEFYKDKDADVDQIIANILKRYDEDMLDFLQKGGYPPTEEQQEEDKELISSMIRAYIDYAKIHDDFEIVSLEEEFNLPVRNPYTGEVFENMRLMGKTDGWGRINDHNFLLEHKTAGRLHSHYWWQHLDQIDFYTYALQRKHGVNFSGAILNVLIKKIPSKPRLLKSGKAISKTLGDTTESVFIAAIDEYGLDINQYQDMLEKIRNQQDAFVRRKPIYRSKDDLEEIEKRIWYNINRKRNLKYYSKVRTDKCHFMCSYKDICIDDNEIVREELYYKKEKAHSELEESELDATS